MESHAQVFHRDYETPRAIRLAAACIQRRMAAESGSTEPRFRQVQQGLIPSQREIADNIHAPKYDRYFHGQDKK